ncbi:hypothetical protein BKM31_31440 [[Actinomadura] parvosata subsp. kistnae]|uniref:Ricin B lectin domain-containing protein n=1 Tax=[Actinomadura] parvosata subsp. kistnae TaxID=1909395 RepID=A0A1V0A573_9ACTN|nr:hypothetical protein [Nonomuraea sp. ATCC 55076]AQZ65366.1 hypothetical protein BKM31_31440 [Nonomuraea sp. ATCC 55076]
MFERSGWALRALVALPVALGSLALTAPAQAGTSSDESVKEIVRLKSVHSGKCLVANLSTTPVQDSCDLRSAQWEHDLGRSTFRNTYVNMCLDTNGSKVYLSKPFARGECNTGDRGQLWRVDTEHLGGYRPYQYVICSQLDGLYSNKAMTFWDDGTISLVQKDSSRKQRFLSI